MSPDEKLAYLQGQITAAEMGVTKTITCPYCDTTLDFSPSVSQPDGSGAPTCCESFALAVIAILQRKEQSEMADLARRIQRNTGGVPVFN